MIDLSISGQDIIFRNIEAQINKFGTELVTAAHTIATLLENYAKSHHLYQDRTTNLTNSTRGTVESIEGDVITIVLSAGMNYAKFVELSGKYAWLEPAIRENAERIKQILRG